MENVETEVINRIMQLLGGDVLIPCPKADQEMWYTPMFASELWTQRRLAKILFHKRGRKAGE